jgi:hypothetical protein
MDEKLNAAEAVDATIVRGAGMTEHAEAHGFYTVECIGRDGKVIWTDTIPNVVTTEGKNLALDTYLAGSSYTVVGPYMGLISSTCRSRPSRRPTRRRRSTARLERGRRRQRPDLFGQPQDGRVVAGLAGSKALSAALSFAITGSGTVKGAFLVYGTGAVNTKDDVNGKLYSAGLFTGGDKIVANLDTVNVSYTAGDTWTRIDAGATAPTTTAQGVLAKGGTGGSIGAGSVAGGASASGVGTT